MSVKESKFSLGVAMIMGGTFVSTIGAIIVLGFCSAFWDSNVAGSNCMGTMFLGVVIMFGGLVKRMLED